MFLRTVAAVVMALLLAPAAAHADTLNTFTASGTYASGATLSGTVILDITNPDLSQASLYAAGGSAVGLPGPDPLGFFAVVTNGCVPADADDSAWCEIVVASELGRIPFMTVVFAADSIADFHGGALASLADPVLDAGLPLTSRIDSDDLAVGSLTPVTATATPEPSTWVLVGSGLLACLAITRRRAC